MDREFDVKNFLRSNFIPLFIGFLGLILIFIGFSQFILKSNNEEQLQFKASNVAETSNLKIMIDVSGAVIDPGVYEMDSDDRIVDALAEAGGMSEDADRDFVSKNINLSSKLSDGLKIYIPRIGEKVLSSNATESGSNSVLNINTAPSAELEKLPGIGPVTAEKIIEGRPYAGIEDLLNKKVIGVKTYESIKDLISAN